MNDDSGIIEQQLRIPTGDVFLDADLRVPPAAQGLVLFAHGSGSSRHSPRNRYVAQVLNEAGLATLLADLLTPEEEEIDEQTRHLRFDIGLLADRVVGMTDWVAASPLTRGLALGYFGAGAVSSLILSEVEAAGKGT